MSGEKIRVGIIGILPILSALGLFWAKGFISLDPDFGWRLRAGQLYLNSGIPATDPFTFTMPSFPWVDHAWLVSAGIGWLYPAIGKLGLTAVFSVFAFLALFISNSRERLVLAKGYFGSITFLLAFVSVLPYFGIRAQVVTWLFLAIFLHTLFDKTLWTKWRLFTPLFFLLWANLHGGFASGLVAFLVVILLKSYRTRQMAIADVSIFVISLFSTLINPHGIGIWREIWSSVSDQSLRWSISEWMPAFLRFDFSLIAFITLSFILITRLRRKFKLEALGLYFAFLLQGVLSSRHIPLWVIVALPLTNHSVNSFYGEVAKIKKGKERFALVYKIVWYGVLGAFLFQAFFSLRNATYLSEAKFYPEGAVQYLKQISQDGEMFSKYGWGGYLIWKYPEKKVFVDGRMPSWRWDKAPENESSSAFDEYNDLLSGEIGYKEIFEKYGVDTVLWPAPKSPGFYDLLQERLDNLLVKFGKEKSDFDFLKQLSEDGWQEVYKDLVAVIYRKQS